MATTAQHIAARNDTDLLARLVAAAEMAEAHRAIADVHAYAVSQQPPPPGANPAAVTDAQLTTAVQAVHV